MQPKRTYKKKGDYSKKSAATADSFSLVLSGKAKYLIIVESPSKCKKIEEYLGEQYICIASKGHLRSIDGLKSIQTKGNFEITFSIIDEKKDHIEKMRTIIQKFSPSNILLATDDDREGEAISWHICEIFNLPIDHTPRILFHEITKPALLKAVQNPTRVNMSLVKAQHARQVLDILVGFKVSPFLWKYIYCSKSKSLSAGRCQTPALRLVYDNEKERESAGALATKYKTTAHFFSKNLPFCLNTEFENPEAVIQFLELSKTFSHKLSIGSPRPSTQSPPKPLNTSRLLQCASNVLHLSPKQTMDYCQQLYQNGHITYMRTDSQKYSKDFLEKMGTMIDQKWGAKYRGNFETLENRNANLPHEAIRATHLENATIHCEDTRMSSLYRFIWKNTVESCMAESKSQVRTIQITAPLENHYSYVLEIPLFLGWKLCSSKENLEEKQNEENGLLFYLQSIEKAGSLVSYNEIHSVVSVQNRHSHYTEASLIQKLEDLGIGRPSTFSMIVETIQERGYVVKKNLEGEKIQCLEFHLVAGKSIERTAQEKVFGNEKNKLVITPTGVLTADFLNQYFLPLFSYDYTKQMEEQLDGISASNTSGGSIEWYELCKNCHSQIKELSRLMKTVEKQSYPIADGEEGDTDETVKKEEYKVVFQQFGPVLKKTLEDGTIEYKSIKKDLKLDLEKLKKGEYTLDDLLEIKQSGLGSFQEKEVLLKNGRYGPYIEWGDKKTSVKVIKKELNDITLEDVLPFIDENYHKNFVKEGESIENTRTLAPSPIKNLIRNINTDLSIRKGKFGAYLYYKTSEMKTPEFYGLSKLKVNFTKCELEVLKEWIAKTYPNLL
jgi:DNA topoisomerase-1